MSRSSRAVTLPSDALAQLMRLEVMRAHLAGHVPGAAAEEIVRDEFWTVVDVVDHHAGQTFASKAAAKEGIFAETENQNFGIRRPLLDAVLGLLTSKGPS